MTSVERRLRRLEELQLEALQNLPQRELLGNAWMEGTILLHELAKNGPGHSGVHQALEDFRQKRAVFKANDNWGPKNLRQRGYNFAEVVELAVAAVIDWTAIKRECNMMEMGMMGDANDWEENMKDFVENEEIPVQIKEEIVECSDMYDHELYLDNMIKTEPELLTGIGAQDDVFSPDTAADVSKRGDVEIGIKESAFHVAPIKQKEQDKSVTVQHLQQPATIQTDERHSDKASELNNSLRSPLYSHDELAIQKETTNLHEEPPNKKQRFQSRENIHIVPSPHLPQETAGHQTTSAILGSTQSNILKCSLCEGTFMKQYALDAHMAKCGKIIGLRLLYEAQTRYTNCKLCGRAYSKKQPVAVHIAICIERMLKKELDTSMRVRCNLQAPPIIMQQHSAKPISSERLCIRP